MSAVRVPPAVASLEPWVEAGVFGPTEVHVADWVVRASGNAHPLVMLAVGMASWAAQHGHACADLSALAEAVAAEHAVRNDDQSAVELAWPDPAEWSAALRGAADVVRVVDTVDAEPVFGPHPLVLHGDRVYLQRYWVDECGIASALRTRAGDLPADLTPTAAAVLEQLLPALDHGEPNLQRAAADAVVANRIALVVGGPGTGKTYSVARMLAVLLEQQPSLRVGLAAPTGKAAARLQESIAAALQQPDVEQHISAEVRHSLAAVTPTTIHRLLGPLGDRRQRFRYDASNPLPHDVVVIDETSMVSLPLMARLLEAVRPDARLVLIGDPDQLESVDLGAVLGDLVQVAVDRPEGVLAGRGCRLVRGHRYGGDTPIALVADAVRRGDAAMALQHLRADVVVDGSSVRFHECLDPTVPAAVAAVEQVVGPHLVALRAAAEAGDAEGALAASAAVRILCAHREGPFGVSTWNRLAEQWMCGPAGGGGVWFAGRPLLATRNDPRLGLANGDTGVVVREGGQLMAVFHTALGRQSFHPVQLSEVRTAFAMTVHKSQGSEYPTVVLVLPPRTSPLVGRELVYTGATRAKTTLHVVGDPVSFSDCLATPARRMTGLADALRSGSPGA
ncbi:MAG: hypothetical protein RL238_3626 [Actinomycetota bacterium]|jgi:exodeoxyribonuclease V alpha subunit